MADTVYTKRQPIRRLQPSPVGQLACLHCGGLPQSCSAPAGQQRRALRCYQRLTEALEACACMPYLR